METLHHIFASFDIFGTLARSVATSLSHTLNISFLPFFEKSKIYFLDHQSMFTALAGFVVIFGIYSGIRRLMPKSSPVRIRKN